MATMQLEDIRDMGEALTRARELCGEAQHDKGLDLFTKTLARLRQFIRRMSKMSERQPWLQLQIELENELSLYTDYAELLQAFKTPPGVAAASKRKHHHPRPAGPVDEPVEPVEPAQPVAWEVHSHEPRKASDDRDPDVWAPPSPCQQQGHGRLAAGGGGLARAPPPWANVDNNSNRANNRAAKPSPVQQNARGVRDAPSGRRTPSDDQRKQARPPAQDNRRNNSNAVKNANAAKGGKSAADGKAGAGGAPKGPSGGGELIGGKKKYSEFAREEGLVDIDLIEMIERDIVDTASKISFENIAGLEHTKQLLQEAVMLPQIAPHLFKDGRLKPCSGVLMFGPPGTGKTLLAKAVANVCHSTFFNVSASTLASKYRGESEKMVRVLFDMARYYSPAIIFMDEIDAIAGARGGAQEHESSRRVKTELLVQMNGVSSGDPGDPNNRVMVLAATNLPWELDEAMRRRLTKRVYIPLPGTDGRRQLFQLNLGKVDVAPDIDYDKLVASTEGYSGDDICGLCETAKMMPVKRLYTPEVLKELHRKKQEGVSEEELQAHEKNALVVTWADFETALENVSKSVGADQLERFAKWEEEFGSK